MPYGAGAEKWGGGLPGKDFYLRSLRCGGGGAEELILRFLRRDHCLTTSGPSEVVQ